MHALGLNPASTNFLIGGRSNCSVTTQPAGGVIKVKTYQALSAECKAPDGNGVETS